MPSSLRAVIFDLGGSLVHFPSWNESAANRWSASYAARAALGLATPGRGAYVHAMREVVVETPAAVPALVTAWDR